MAPVSLDVGGRQVEVTHPDKVIFPDQDGRAGHTKLDLIQYYLAVADGALRGVAGRPMILKRFSKGIDQEAIFQKRAPEKRPEWVDVAELRYASGTSAKEAVIHDAAGLAWAINLGCVDLNPHPVLADDLDHPDELRVDLDPMPGVTWPAWLGRSIWAALTSTRIRCSPTISTTPTNCASIWTRCPAWNGDRSSTSHRWPARCSRTTG